MTCGLRRALQLAQTVTGSRINRRTGPLQGGRGASFPNNRAETLRCVCLGAKFKPESLILAQNERWRRA